MPNQLLLAHLHAVLTRNGQHALPCSSNCFCKGRASIEITGGHACDKACQRQNQHVGNCTLKQQAIRVMATRIGSQN